MTANIIKLKTNCQEKMKINSKTYTFITNESTFV